MFLRIKELYFKNRLIATFLLRGSAFYLLWLVFYDLGLFHTGWLDDFLIGNLIVISNFFLELFGYETFQANTYFGILNTSGVEIGAPCNAFSLMVLYSGFILAFPGSWKRKLAFIPLGIVGIHALNVLRVIALVLLVLYSPSSLEFNHSYTFTLIVYGCIFLMWMAWIKYYTKKK